MRLHGADGRHGREDRPLDVLGARMGLGEGKVVGELQVERDLDAVRGVDQDDVVDLAHVGDRRGRGPHALAQGGVVVGERLDVDDDVDPGRERSSARSTRPERGATSLRQGYGGPPKLQRRRKSPRESERGWGPASIKK